ncbi:hypothetical protein L249_3536 [Ophiocordyceps polyrhachis-furcata BCC 54312]|uniref:Uncharacterized protein n=1 Tax=Ophiocordyceps polyrhachis-furcata BCC 54312 TaxID=1330021 RepID=A0A367LM18_9HYPO|nr:hypothetical protein L249_3536 [Ophiocordyceps polyrhachis-furcata BCC 54312]
MLIGRNSFLGHVEHVSPLDISIMALGTGTSRAVARLLAYGMYTSDASFVPGLTTSRQKTGRGGRERSTLFNRISLYQTFLEDGHLYKERCNEHDRARILAPFNIPPFLTSQLCTDCNGYFGCKSSFDANECLVDLSMWFRCLAKTVLDTKKERCVQDGKDYFWHEMGFFTRWCHPRSSKILCVGTPTTFHDGLLRELDATPRLELRDPFSMLIPLLSHIVQLYDESTWRVRDKVREIEKTRGRHRADFVGMHDISRHAIHLDEVYTATIETMENLLRRQKLTQDAIVSLDKTYKEQAQELTSFHLQLMKSLKLRSISNHERLNSEIILAYHIITSQDSTVTRTIGVLTMTFLPASFVAALFGTTFFSSAEDKRLAVSSKFWTYWVVAVPSTLLVLLAWWLFLQKSSSRKRWS